MFLPKHAKRPARDNVHSLSVSQNEIDKMDWTAQLYSAPLMTAIFTPATTTPPSDFIRTAVREDLDSGRFSSIATRFPPEPNGYLHIGHAKAIAVDFGIAREFGGKCNLRFDDTNPAKEEQEYVDQLMADIRWLGYEWDGLFFASDYFEALYGYAVKLIEKGKAYVDDLSADQIRAYRGTLTESGKDSPFRNRSVEENLDLFARMRAGEFPEGTRTLRAKIDMASGNINMRDPVMYRILYAEHHTPATRGASTRSMILPTARATASKASRIRCARWNTKRIGRSTTGSCASWRFMRRGRWSSRA